MVIEMSYGFMQLDENVISENDINITHFSYNLPLPPSAVLDDAFHDFKTHPVPSIETVRVDIMLSMHWPASRDRHES